MRRITLAVFLIVGLMAVGGTGIWADAPEVHQAITEYTGPETCGTCHPESAKEVAESVHYQHQAIPKFREGWPEGEPGGMLVTY
jgi:hypothetical protein